MAKSGHDVVVLGAGAAGLMAAIRARECGARVLLLEKNRRPGVKILASGGGRCNLTTTREGSALEASFPDGQGRWLRPSLRALPPARLRLWFERAGVALQEEDQEKVFPRAGRASVVLQALVDEGRRVGVELLCGVAVLDVRPRDGGFDVVASEGVFPADQVILAVGGRSYPKSGTTGDGYGIAQRLGHRVAPLRPGLVGLVAADVAVQDLAGVAVAEARVWTAGSGPRGVPVRPLLFTHRGISGPGAMNLARDLDTGGRVVVDLLPGQVFETVEREILALGQATPRRLVSGLLPPSLPQRLRDLVVQGAGIDQDARASDLTRTQRRALVHGLKDWTLPISGTLGWDRAEVTVGGVPLEEVEPKTLASRVCPGLSLCGEILDVDGPIGGFNFQAAFATGWVAGEVAARRRRGT